MSAKNGLSRFLHHEITIRPPVRIAMTFMQGRKLWKAFLKSLLVHSIRTRTLSQKKLCSLQGSRRITQLSTPLRSTQIVTECPLRVLNLRLLSSNILIITCPILISLLHRLWNKIMDSCHLITEELDLIPSTYGLTEELQRQLLRTQTVSSRQIKLLFQCTLSHHQRVGLSAHLRQETKTSASREHMRTFTDQPRRCKASSSHKINNL